MSSCTALLTVLQPLVTQGNEHLPDNLVSSETTDDFTDLPDVVSSVLNVIYGIMENEDCSGICFMFACFICAVLPFKSTRYYHLSFFVAITTYVEILQLMCLWFPDQVKPLVPDWASQELKQESCPRNNGLVEGWFPLSDQSGISCNLMESMRLFVFDCLSRCSFYDFISV